MFRLSTPVLLSRIHQGDTHMLKYFQIATQLGKDCDNQLKSNKSQEDNIKGYDESTRSQFKEKMRNSRDNTKRNIVIGACMLVMLYMYPSIFRPLFGIESTTDNRQKREAVLEKVAQTRPGNMPEWSSPFGPKLEKKKSE